MDGFASMLLSGGTPPIAQVLYGIGYFFIYVFVLSSMFLTGLSATPGDLLEPVRDRRLLGVALCTNFVLVPLLALVLIALIPMNEQLAGGLLLVSIAAGAPTTMKVAQVTGGNVARAVSLTILMTMVTIVIMPLLLPIILPWAQADPLEVTRNLVVLILIPIILGLLLRSRSPALAGRLTPVMDWTSDISTAIILLTLGIVFLLRLGGFAGSSSGALAIPVAILFTLGALGLGYLLGGFSEGSREEIAFGAGSRNITAALVVIFASYSNARNDVLLMVLMVTAFSVIIISILVGIIYKRRWHDEELPPAGSEI
ncbi:MAG: bile acid:sodium symporter [Methanomicrobiales archaeon]|nr:bile acid:sodium symporter [Methanomicrobiales archaeon]